MSAKANQARDKYYFWKTLTIVFGAIVPGLIGFNFGDEFAKTVKIAALILSIIVAISAALEEFFKYGERWRHYRTTSELLKSEGWSFISLTEHYQRYTTHSKAFDDFANHVENILRLDVRTYISSIAGAEKQKKEEKKSGGKNGG